MVGIDVLKLSIGDKGVSEFREPGPREFTPHERRPRNAGPIHGCQFLGERLDDNGPAIENVPCITCGSRNGRADRAVFECTSPENPGGECLPTYKPDDFRYAAFLAEKHRPFACARCPHFTPPA